MKKKGRVLCLILAIVIMAMLAMGSGGSSGGDGKSTCRNCGRKKPLSAFGYCSTCQQGYNDWEKRQRSNN